MVSYRLSKLQLEKSNTIDKSVSRSIARRPSSIGEESYVQEATLN